MSKTKQARLATLLAARAASAAGDHTEAERLFGTVGISYVPSHQIHN